MEDEDMAQDGPRLNVVPSYSDHKMYYHKAKELKDRSMNMVIDAIYYLMYFVLYAFSLFVVHIYQGRRVCPSNHYKPRT